MRRRIAVTVGVLLALFIAAFVKSRLDNPFTPLTGYTTEDVVFDKVVLMGGDYTNEVKVQGLTIDQVRDRLSKHLIRQGYSLKHSDSHVFSYQRMEGNRFATVNGFQFSPEYVRVQLSRPPTVAELFVKRLKAKVRGDES